MSDSSHCFPRSTDVLSCPLIRVSTSGGLFLVGLAGVLDLLNKGDVLSFPGCHPHQSFHVHSFFVQLAFLALRGKSPESIEDEQGWIKALRALTVDGWSLFPGHEGESLSKPGFLQPPLVGVPVKTPVLTPFDADVIINTSSVDAKRNRPCPRDILLEQWIFALISRQTHSGSVRGSAPASRQSSGVQCRVGITVSRPGASLSEKFRRDLNLLTRYRWPDRFKLDRPGLLWVLPWDGRSQLSFSDGEVHPLYIDVSIPIRLLPDGTALKGSSFKSRVNVHSGSGKDTTDIDIHDPWVAYDLERSKFLYHPRLDYRTVGRVLSDRGKYSLGVAAAIGSSDRGDLQVTFHHLEREQGKTLCYSEYIVHVPGSRRTLFDAENISSLSERTGFMIDRAGEGESFLYKLSGILERREGTPPLKKTEKRKATFARLKEDFKSRVDSLFFPALFSESENPEDEWTDRVVKTVRDLVSETLDSRPFRPAVHAEVDLALSVWLSKTRRVKDEEGSAA